MDACAPKLNRVKRRGVEPNPDKLVGKPMTFPTRVSGRSFQRLVVSSHIG